MKISQLLKETDIKTFVDSLDEELKKDGGYAVLDNGIVLYRNELFKINGGFSFTAKELKEKEIKRALLGSVEND